VTFIDPHALLIGSGLGDEKIKLHRTIRDSEKRLNDPEVILNSFILSWTPHPRLKWDQTRAALEHMHVLFMQDDKDHYIDKLFDKIKKSAGRVNTRCCRLKERISRGTEPFRDRQPEGRLFDRDVGLGRGSIQALDGTHSISKMAEPAQKAQSTFC
jgi:hypothetical protein